MSPSNQHKSSKSSFGQVFGYRRRSMTSQQKQQYIAPPPPPAEHRRTHSNNGTSGTVSSSSSRSSMNLEPSPHVAEWCHQMHMIQNKKYDWCHGCHPRVIITPPNMQNVPSERAIQQQLRRKEPTHAYQ